MARLQCEIRENQENFAPSARFAVFALKASDNEKAMIAIEFIVDKYVENIIIPT